MEIKHTKFPCQSESIQNIFEYDSFCKTHNHLCCSSYIEKNKSKYNYQYPDCDFCLIEDIKDEKRNRLKENIKFLGNLPSPSNKLIEEIKRIFEKINENKEELKYKIQKIFTKIRNVINGREDELLLDIDRQYDKQFCDDYINKNIIHLSNQIKISLEKGIEIDHEWNNNNNNDKKNNKHINSLINSCIRIENNIKDINELNEKIKKLNINKNKIIGLNLEENEINEFLEKIKIFGKIYNKNDYNIKSKEFIHILDYIHKVDEKSKEFISLLEESKEREKNKKLKKKILQEEKEFRNPKKIINENKEEKEKRKNKEINRVLENMCIYGNILKKEIKEEKQKNPQKFIEKEEALKSEKKDPELFALALLADVLEKNGINTVIVKDEDKKDDEEEGLTCLGYLLNGLNNKIKKYDLHFDFGEERNNELLNNESEYNNFIKKLKLKIGKEYNVSVDKIIITFPQRGSFHVQLIFQSEEFNNLNLEEFKNKFNNDPEFNELNNLKEIHSDLLIGQIKLSKNDLDPEGNRSSGWGIHEKRGNKRYYPPLNWTGIGIKVIDKYDDGNNDWIGMENIEGEWCVAYHGLCRGQESNNVKKITRDIAKGEKVLKPGEGKAHKNCDDLLYQNHPGEYDEDNKVGEGVYVTPKIKITIEHGYAGISTINGVDYYTALMVRVKPKAIRHCACYKDYWVINGSPEEIRPYRILYKKNEDDEDDEDDEYNEDDEDKEEEEEEDEKEEEKEDEEEREEERE